MKQGLVTLMLIAVMIAAGSSLAFAQGGATSSLSGFVVDTSGGAVPGATVEVKNNATGATFVAVTSSQGDFAVPSLNPGTYTVTISLSGFKTVQLADVVLNAGVPGSVRATLDVGGVSETVVVQGTGEIVQTQSSSVAQTLNVNQISNLPLTSRNALDFITFLPGVNTPGGNRNSTVNGLPQSAINITVDGMNVQDNFLKTTDGFFARMSPRLDAVEEVTVTTAAQGADSSGQGAVQIRFTTRSGSNTFTGSAYHYYRNDALNANTYFNRRDDIAKPDLLQNQPGFRVGGPIVIPGLYDGHNKAFFFVNYEEFRQPQDITRNRTILTPEAQAGVFSYTTSAGVRTVNVLELAAANGFLATPDPVVAKLLADIRSATATTGTITQLEDPVLQRYSTNVAQRSKNEFPTFRVDLNLTERHRLTGSYNYNHILSTPDTLNNRDPVFPGFPVVGDQDSDRYTWSTSLRSNLGASLVNEFRVGGTGGATQFNPGMNAGMWNAPGLGNQAGFQLGISTANINNASSAPTPSSREASTKLISNNVSWLRGSHSLNFGIEYTQVDLWLKNQTLVPTINFDVLTGDPAKNLFATANFPGASGTQIGDAEDLYAVLVGSVSSITATSRINEDTNRFEYLGLGIQRGRMRDVGLFAQDQWRLRPDLTLNYGLRYEMQLPFYSRNSSYSTATLESAWGVSGYAAGCDSSNITPATCNLFRPGVMPGAAPTFVNLEAGVRAYEIDWDNVAPSVGVAWTPTADSGFFQRFLGQPGDTVFRAGYARAYERHGMSDFSDVFGGNPGVAISSNRDNTQGNLGALPLYFRETDRLGAPEVPETLGYPYTEVVTGDLGIFDPNLQVPYADTWTAGWQRSISRNMAVEVRYVGTRARDLWTEYNLNETNILENGFLEEFKLAQANLQANIAAGRGNTFRYFGAGTGTSPLPTYLAYFNGSADAGNAGVYTGNNWTNTTFVNRLALQNPNVFSAASDLWNGNATLRGNALNAGLPANQFIANPDLLGGSGITGNGGYTNYNSMQFELRRRMASGLQFQTSYVWGRGYESNRYSFRVGRKESLDTGAEGGVTHAIKANWLYELPFGQGKAFANNAGPVMERLIGGWQVHGTARVQSGRLVDFGNVRLVGMSMDELRDVYQVRKDADGRVYMLPQDVIDNTVRAFSVSATSPTGYSSLGAPEGRYLAPASGPDCIETIANGYGDCGLRTVVLDGPMFRNVDLSVVKLVPITGRVRAEFRLEMLNAFDFVNFVPVATASATATNYEVTALNGANTSRVLQLVSRVTW